MSRSRALFYCSLIGFSIVAYQLGMDFNWASRKLSFHENFFSHPKSKKIHRLEKHAPSPKNALTSGNTTILNEDEINSFLNAVNHKNDWLVSLDAERRELLLKDSLSHGIRVVNHIAELGVVRFSIVDSGKAFPLLKEFIETNRISFNHPLRQPVSPRQEEVFEGASFSNSFIEWMGGKSTRNAFGQGVKVAILDSGVDPTHPALNGVLIQEKDLVQKLPNQAWQKRNAHGTAIASVISSSFDDYVGIAPGCEILSYRVIDQSGFTDSFTVASAIISAVEDGADVINLSLGGDQGSMVLEQAVSHALLNGVSLVAAVGNEGLGKVNYPAAYDGVIGVSSVGSSGRVANFSNFGDGVDLAAPGVGLLTAGDSSKMGLFSGTSISTAIVTGAIAMELARNPNLSQKEVERLLQETSNEAEMPGFDSLSGYGVLSLSRLENKSNPSFTDPAITGYHFKHLDGVNEGTLPFEVMVQNQGNTWLRDLLLRVNYLGMNKTIPIGSMAPGELRIEKLYLQGTDFDNSVQINSYLQLPSGIIDFRTDNNKRSSVISF